MVTIIVLEMQQKTPCQGFTYLGVRGLEMITSNIVK